MEALEFRSNKPKAYMSEHNIGTKLSEKKTGATYMGVVGIRLRHTNLYLAFCGRDSLWRISEGSQEITNLGMATPQSWQLVLNLQYSFRKRNFFFVEILCTHHLTVSTMT
jgi:hypothetical protein